MKVVFLCGCLEPGRDGVGDYTRRMAGELLAAGHQANLVALEDTYIQQVTKEEQKEEDFFISALRIPHQLPAHEKIQLARKRINEEQPDWVSVQFVLFAYHSKGLAFNISRYFKEITSGYRVHIMFHELWVGMNREATLKHKIWGWVQKQIIRNLLATVKPVIINTQTELYVNQLTGLGFKAQYLSMFSAIPVISAAAKNEKETIRLVIFGGIHKDADLVNFARQAAEYSRQNKTTELVLIGRNGAYEPEWKREWTAAGLPVASYGEQPKDMVSEILQTCSFGICTTPSALIGKSSSVMAIRVHGLPILCVSHSWHPSVQIPLSLPDNTIIFNGTNFSECMKLQKKEPDINNASRIASSFIHSLSSNQ